MKERVRIISKMFVMKHLKKGKLGKEPKDYNRKGKIKKVFFLFENERLWQWNTF